MIKKNLIILLLFSFGLTNFSPALAQDKEINNKHTVTPKTDLIPITKTNSNQIKNNDKVGTKTYNRTIAKQNEMNDVFIKIEKAKLLLIRMTTLFITVSAIVMMRLAINRI